MVEAMTSRERLLALLRGEPTDRIGVTTRGVRSWDARWCGARHESFRPVIEAVRRHGDWLAPIGFESGFYYSVAPLRGHSQVRQVAGHPEVEHRVTVVEGPRGPLREVVAWNKVQQLSMPVEHYVKTPADLENFLGMAWAPPRPDVGAMLALDARIADRGIVQVSIGSDPVGDVHSLLGTETLAYWSFEHRDLIHRLLAEMLRRKLDVVEHLISTGIHRRMPVLYGHTGAEIVIPPLQSPEDFRDFCVRYDKPLHDRMHEAGAFVHVHCHGSIRRNLEDFVTMGTDMLHPVEAPPLGDTPLGEAKRQIGDRVVIEGNVQIADALEEEAGAFRRRIEGVIADGKPGGRFALCPTASPYPVVLSDRAVRNYLTMIEMALEAGRY